MAQRILDMREDSLSELLLLQGPRSSVSRRCLVSSSKASYEGSQQWEDDTFISSLPIPLYPAISYRFESVHDILTAILFHFVRQSYSVSLAVRDALPSASTIAIPDINTFYLSYIQADERSSRTAATSSATTTTTATASTTRVQ